MLERRGLRDDYREFLELTLLFFGVVQPQEARFHAPRSVHHAHWMAKAIYALKTWMLSEQLRLMARKESGIRNICIFVARF